ncbi:MAG TPA: LysM domain-containing protein [Longimicrobium sp.]|nr:LysM domain-containing protein [Longimicrobium sp.]
MFDSASRYAGLETASMEVPDPDGGTRTVRYVRRRFVPQPGGDTTLVEHTVEQGDRLDRVTARYLGDPTQFWRVCDSNGALRPDELVEEPGRRIRIALPGV